MSKFDLLNENLAINLGSAMQITELYDQIIDVAVTQIKSLGNVMHPTTGANASDN